MRKPPLYLIIQWIVAFAAAILLGKYIARTYSVFFIPFIVFSMVLPFINIRYSIYVLVSLIPFEGLAILKELTLLKIWGIYVLGVYVAKNIIGRKKLGLEIPRVHKVALIFLPLAILSTFFSIDRVASLYRSLTLIQLVVFSILIYSIVKYEGHVSIARVFFAASGIVCSLHILQYFGILNAPLLEVELQHMQRIQGYTGDPNRFGMTMLPAIYLGMASIVTSRDIFWKIMTGVVILIIIVGIALSISRASILTLIFSLLIFTGWQFYKKGPARSSILILLCVIFALCFYVSNTQSPRIAATREYARMRFRLVASPQSVGPRMKMITIGARMLLDNPLGVGPDNFAKAGLLFYGQGRDAHNSVMEVAGEFGFPGLLCFLIMLFLAIKPMSFRANSTKHDPERIVVFSLVVFFIMSLTLTAIYNKMFWFLIGLAAASGEYIKREEIYNEKLAER